MVAVTYGVGRVPTVEAAAKTGRAGTAAPRRNWFLRVMDALIEARMQQARREVSTHTRLIPFTRVKADPNDIPFGGW